MNNLASKVILAVAVTGSAHAFAATGSKDQTLDLVGLKSKCAELQQNEQLKPFKAVVSCNQVVTEWRTSTTLQADPVSIKNTRQIGASFTLKGYEVPFEAEVADIAPAFAPCSMMEQVRRTVPAVDIELSCEALAKVQSISEFCGPAINERLQADPSIQIEELTGRTFDSCKGH